MRLSGDLEKKMTIMFVATAIADIANYLFHVFMGSALGSSESSRAQKNCLAAQKGLV